MEPAFYRGDILLLNNASDPVRVGEIVVFKLEGRDIPIVHRVLKVHTECARAHSRPPLSALLRECDAARAATAVAS
jgi:signal peptidase I